MSAAPAQVTITLPDGKTMTFARGVTGAEIAAAIGPGLAKAALILEVDGKEWDLFRPIEARRPYPHHHQEGRRSRWS